MNRIICLKNISFVLLAVIIDNILSKAVSNRQVAVSPDSRALKVLKELVEMGVIVKQGKWKGSCYTIKDCE